MANIEAKYHLDEPLWSQYLYYIGGALKGDLGPSYKYIGRDVSDIILDDYSADYTNIYKDYDITKNVTGNKMTKYEYTKVLGMRAQQITMGAEPLIKISNDMKSAIEVAEEELRQRKTPYIIARKINKKKTDFWKIEDMIIEVI